MIGGLGTLFDPESILAMMATNHTRHHARTVSWAIGDLLHPASDSPFNLAGKVREANRNRIDFLLITTCTTCPMQKDRLATEMVITAISQYMDDCRGTSHRWKRLFQGHSVGFAMGGSANLYTLRTTVHAVACRAGVRHCCVLPRSKRCGPSEIDEKRHFFLLMDRNSEPVCRAF